MKKYLGGVLAVALGTTLLFSCGPTERKLPIYGERSPVEREVDGKKVVDTIYHTIPNFSFLNQDSTTITQDFF